MTDIRLDENGLPRLALKKPDAAKALGVSVTFFQREIQGELPTIYKKGLRLYRVRDLEAWLDSQACVGGRAA